VGLAKNFEREPDESRSPIEHNIDYTLSTVSPTTSTTQSVRLLCTSGDVPVMVNGEVSSEADGIIVVQPAGSAEQLSPGDRVVLTFADADQRRVTGTIQTIGTGDDGAGRIEVTCTDQRDRDQRDFPRLFAGLPIRYRLADSATATAWLAGEEAEDGDWFRPDPFMNFSVGGLRFDADRSVATNDLLLIDFAVSEAGARWRLTGRVIRVFEPASPDAETHSIAVALVAVPDEAHEALSDLTLKIQDTLL